jgi:ATP-dependent helicase/nuclease subunit B
MPLNEFEISPNETALTEISQKIWSFAISQGKMPFVITSTAGPIRLLRIHLEKNRPSQLPLSLAFLPKIVSVSEWLKQTPALIQSPTLRTTLERWEMVYAHLAKFPKIAEKFGALGEGGKWALVKSILQACDFLTRAHLAFVFSDKQSIEHVFQEAQQQFDQAIAKAYPDIDKGLISDEAALILAFWRHLSSTDDPVVREAMSYPLRLADAINENATPIVWIEMARPLPTIHHMQEQFLQAYAKEQEVLRITMKWQDSALWQECLTGKIESWTPEINHQIAHHRQQYTEQNWRLISMPSFEKMAWGAITALQEHVQAGRKHLALIAQDRLVARRVRALLDRLGPSISVIDRTGWKLSTTSAAAAVNSYLELINQSPGPNTSSMMGFLKNPLLDLSEILTKLSGTSELDPNDFAWFMESTILASSPREHWQDWVQLFEPEEHDDFHDEGNLHMPNVAQAWMNQLQEHSQGWRSGYQTSADWSKLLQEDLKACGMYHLLENDLAGKSVLVELEQLAQIRNTPMSPAAWVSLFDAWMEQASFIQEARYSEITISIIPLSSIRLHPYDAVVVVGCDDGQLPSSQDHGSIFSDSLLAAFDEHLPHHEYISQAKDLSQLLSTHKYVDFLWQEFQSAGEKNRPSPWLTRLQMGMPSFKKATIEIPFDETPSHPQEPAKTSVLFKELLKNEISPSAYQSLRSCPYRFFVTYVLGLRSPKALQDLSEFGAIGTLLHDILKKFYRAYAKQRAWSYDEQKREWMEKELRNISTQEWGHLVKDNGKLLFEQQQWLEQIPDWVSWQLSLEAQGWRFSEAEKNLEFVLHLSSELTLMIKGRADRIDVNASGAYRVWDYKYKTLSSIKGAKKYFFEDPQLLIYSKGLLESPGSHKIITDTGWLSLRDSDRKSREVMQEVTSEVLQTMEEQMTGLLKQVWGGGVLPANGPTQVCQYCDARGICRKGMW